MLRKTVAGICNTHGFYTGEFCVECELNPKEDVFYTSKDKLWEFTVRDGEKEIPIATKGQWKRYMKERGLNDDTPKYRGLDGVMQAQEKFKNSYKPVDRRFIKNEILKELHEKGLTNKLLKRRQE